MVTTDGDEIPTACKQWPVKTSEKGRYVMNLFGEGFGEARAAKNESEEGQAVDEVSSVTSSDSGEDPPEDSEEEQEVDEAQANILDLFYTECSEDALLDDLVVKGDSFGALGEILHSRDDFVEEVMTTVSRSARKVIWEVFVAEGGTSLEFLRNFSQPEIIQEFLKKLGCQKPDEVFFAPSCRF